MAAFDVKVVLLGSRDSGTCRRVFACMYVASGSACTKRPASSTFCWAWGPRGIALATHRPVCGLASSGRVLESIRVQDPGI